MIPESEVFFASDSLREDCDAASNVATVVCILHVDTETLKHILCRSDMTTVIQINVIPLDSADAPACISPCSLSSEQQFRSLESV